MIKAHRNIDDIAQIYRDIAFAIAVAAKAGQTTIGGYCTGVCRATFYSHHISQSSRYFALATTIAPNADQFTSSSDCPGVPCPCSHHNDITQRRRHRALIVEIVAEEHQTPTLRDHRIWGVTSCHCHSPYILGKPYYLGGTTEPETSEGQVPAGCNGDSMAKRRLHALVIHGSAQIFHDERLHDSRYPEEPKTGARPQQHMQPQLISCQAPSAVLEMHHGHFRAKWLAANNA